MSARGVDRFRALHAGAPLLVLPNVWDAMSAKMVELAGASALATSSAVLAWSAGYPDGQHVPVDELLRITASIGRVSRLPLSVDFERGYADAPRVVAEHAARFVEAGAVGINLEDGAMPADLLAEKIVAVRSAVGDALFVNARTCVVLRGAVQGDALVPELRARAKVYADAGADGFFVPKLRDEREIEAVAGGTTLALNVMIVPELPSPSRLEAVGVRRLSAGPELGLAVMERARTVTTALLERGDYAPLLDHALGYLDVNRALAAAPR